ncbi:spore germination lipoprotein GerD [Mesobacillus foraminis]|uniref:spore germination lipoprotein GerD n=1 Tax=Mesobacillus foraminis TaxID=279826 RepID=UPI001BE5B5A2|nr:spore germination lipoprotein GerD [Mesobacillus foraminis]MBT2758901.1 spore gernimation protein GerD [Mesobacillus foraminis]
MYRAFRLLIPVLLLVSVAGCGTAPDTGAEEMDYDATKKMVVDILKTDDGKKAIQELMKEDGIKESLIMDQTVVSDTIEKTLVSKEGTAFWQESFKDPKFAQAMAKSMQAENEQLLKDLMKDPEYRAMMIEVMKDPELEKELMTTLKSKEYREHLQTVITETFDSPIFKAKMQDMIIQASEEIAAKQQKK